MTASVWNPGSNNIPAVDPLSQIKSQIFTATEGQTDFTITQFTYSLGNGAIDVYVNRSKVPASELTELTSTSFRIPACDVDDLVEVRGNTAISDPGSAVALAQAAAAAAQAAQVAAELAETNAEIAETNAETAETNAETAATSASSSASAAAASAALAATYVPLNWRGDWVTATAYAVNDAFKYAGSSYVVLIAHTSTSVAADLGAGKIDVIAEKGATGDVTGPGVAVDNNIVSFNGTTGDVVKDSGVSTPAVAAHLVDTANPHAVTKAQVGLGNVDNTSDATKNAAVATLTNKTIDLGSNTVSGTKAQFDTAVTDDNFAFLNQAQTFTQLQSFSAGTLVTGAVVSGYGTGAGGTVTQATDKSTSVTLNKPSGTITMHNASLAAGAMVRFACNNTLVTADSVCVANLLLASMSAYEYELDAFVSAGFVTFQVTNKSGAPLADALQIKFDLLAGASS